MEDFRQLVLDQFDRVINNKDRDYLRKRALKGGKEQFKPKLPEVKIPQLTDEPEEPKDVFTQLLFKYLEYLDILYGFYIEEFEDKVLTKKQYMELMQKFFDKNLKGGARKKIGKRRINRYLRFTNQLKKLATPEFQKASDYNKFKIFTEVAQKSFMIIRDEIVNKKEKKELQEIRFKQFQELRKNPKNKNNTWLTFLRLFRKFTKGTAKDASKMWKELKKMGKKENLTNEELITLYRKKPDVVGRALRAGIIRG